MKHPQRHQPSGTTYKPQTYLRISSRTLHSCLEQFYHLKSPVMAVSTQLVFPHYILICHPSKEERKTAIKRGDTPSSETAQVVCHHSIITNTTPEDTHQILIFLINWRNSTTFNFFQSFVQLSAFLKIWGLTSWNWRTFERKGIIPSWFYIIQKQWKCHQGIHLVKERWSLIAFRAA